MFRRGMKEETSLWKSLLLAFLVALAGNAIAQDTATDEDEDDATEMVDEEEADLGKIVVTGSRLQRETYTSIAPLQVITAEGSREAGLIDAADILQQSTAAAGQQIDLTFQGFVLDNGPGSSTVNLRGLGEARTLTLLNGRRLAPAGVEGAPFAANLNIVPASLVQQYDLLLDGASSIYGSDAVAGVANILLRKDFDGFEVDVYYNYADQGAGDNYTASVTWGKNFDRGFIGVGLEYSDFDEVTFADRKWTEGCDKNYEITESGEFRTQDQYYSNVLNMPWDECRLGLLAGRVSVPFAGSIYYTPGFTNGGWPNFSESSSSWSRGTFGIDSNQDGVADLTFRDYDLNGTEFYDRQSLFPDRDNINFMAYGEYTLDGEMNNTPFFEFNYSKLNTFSNSAEGQLFPNVPATNPFNICNPNGIRGVDCGLAQDALYGSAAFSADFYNLFGDICDANGIAPRDCNPLAFGLGSGPIGPAQVLPIVSVAGDRNFNDVSIAQYRFVGGIKGDLPMFNFGPMSSWIYEASLSYSFSEGESSRFGIRGDRLDYALGWYSTTRTPCDGSAGFSSAPRHFGRGLFEDTTQGCVPVDLFAPSLYPGAVTGDFATQAERDYLFDSRDFDTEFEQTIVQVFANGFLWDLPGGPMTAGFGFEWRRDEMDSIPDAVARDGLFWGFFTDGGAVGEKDTTEFFGEVELPLLADITAVEELTVNLSARWTDDELYGSDTTYSAKIGYRPVDSLLLRATWGTSFRAPNLRENFLQNQSGFGGVFDPCFIPEEAWDEFNNMYIPSLDPRDPVVLANCAANGADPTMLYNNGFNTFSTEIAAGGRRDLTAETSDSFTYGFAWEQPWFDTFYLTIGATYYDISIDDTIIEPSAQFLVNDCYNDEQGDSAFCSSIIRNEVDGTFDLINAGFINRDNETAKGWDFNVNFDKTFQVGERSVGVAVDMVLNKTDERNTTFTSADGAVDTDEFAGEWGFPDWKGQLGFRVNVSDFRFSWIANYRGEQNQDPDGVDDFATAFTVSDTCGVIDDDLCRDYADFDDYWLHSASVYYYGDTWTVGVGVRNVFDEAPPFVDCNEIGACYSNTPLGYGYDLMGRTYFANVVWRPGF